MAGTSFRFNVGSFRCLVVSDGSISVPGPPSPGTSSNPTDRPREVMDVSCLLIEQGQRRILVDTGCGSTFQASAGKLLQNLQQEGITPSSIDTIIYTHGHLDHVGGTFSADGKAIYPHARQIVAKKEWDCWASSSETSLNYRMFAYAVKNLLPIADRFELAEDNAEVLPGIKLLPAGGHTTGSIMLELSSGKDKLLCLGDLIHSQLEFTRPEYYSFLDSAPEEAVRLRTEGLRKIAQSGTLVFACHFPFPGTGHILEKDGALSWQPAQQ